MIEKRQGAERNKSRPDDVCLATMDDKTMNLWRQIEEYRRQGRKRKALIPAPPVR
jgi:hypothetical protein